MLLKQDGGKIMIFINGVKNCNVYIDNNINKLSFTFQTVCWDNPPIKALKNVLRNFIQEYMLMEIAERFAYHTKVTCT